MPSADDPIIPPVPLVDYYASAQKLIDVGALVAGAAVRLDALETWRRQVIDNGLPDLEKRISALEQIARDMQSDLHTIMGSVGTLEGSTDALASIQRDIKELQHQQALQNAQWADYAARQRRIAEAQEAARAAQEEARKVQIATALQAKHDAEAIKTQVASLANRGLLLGAPILIAFGVNTLALDTRWRTAFSYGVVIGLIVLALFFAMRYVRILVLERRARQGAAQTQREEDADVRRGGSA